MLCGVSCISHGCLFDTFGKIRVYLNAYVVLLVPPQISLVTHYHGLIMGVPTLFFRNRRLSPEQQVAWSESNPTKYVCSCAGSYIRCHLLKNPFSPSTTVQHGCLQVGFAVSVLRYCTRRDCRLGRSVQQLC